MLPAQPLSQNKRVLRTYCQDETEADEKPLQQGADLHLFVLNLNYHLSASLSVNVLLTDTEPIWLFSKSDNTR